MTQSQTTLTGVTRAETAVRFRLSGLGAAALLVSAIYTGLAIVLVGQFASPSGEAIARTAHLGTLWSGYDPTAQAFGAERPPLPSLFGLPFAAVPLLREHGLAGALGVAITGGTGVFVAGGLARWAGFGAITSFVFVTAFALHPLLLIAGATGLSETLYATLVLAACAQFIRWLDRESTAPVIIAGTALGAAYLLRYNVIWIALAIACAMYVVARNRGSVSERDERAQATALAFMVPVVFFMGLWAITSWFMTGDLFAILREPARLTALAANDASMAAERNLLRWSPIEVALWFGRWVAIVAPLSAIAIAALLLLGGVRRNLGHLALGGVLVSIAVSEAISLVTGLGLPYVSHLYVLVSGAFLAVAYAERIRTGGRRPEAFERTAKRRQAMFCGVLLIGSLASAAVLPWLPSTDAPTSLLPERLQRAVTRPPNTDAAEVAAWVREHAAPGDVVADHERVAEVMVATGDYGRFFTTGDTSGEVVVSNPAGIARFMLVRRPVPGAGVGVIERAHIRIFDAPSALFSFEFEAGDYRIYRVDAERQGR